MLALVVVRMEMEMRKLRKKERMLLLSKLNSASPEVKEKVLSLLMKECGNETNVSVKAVEATALIFAAVLSEGKKAVSWRLVSKYMDVMRWHDGTKINKGHVGRIISVLDQKGVIEKIGRTLFLRTLAECVC